MSKLKVTKSLLDNLADSISAKSGEPIPMTIPEMTSAVDSIQVGGNLQTKSVSYTPTETAQSGTVTPDSNYNGLSSVSVSVGAIPSNYVGSGVTRRYDDDMSGSPDPTYYYIVTAPSGYYPSSAEYVVPAGSLIGNINVMVLDSDINLAIDDEGLIVAEFHKGESATPVYQSGYIRNTEALYASTSGYKTLQLTKRTANDLTLSGGAVTAPSGYYPNDSSITVGDDGNFLKYGLTDGTSPLVGVAKIGEAVLFETSPQIGTAQAGFTTVV